MKFSLKWLGDFIEVKQFFNEPKILAQTLTQAGLEVDAFEDQKARFENLVVAQIESVKKHPQADRLTLCKVSTGNKSHFIVCGAKNHKVGDKVVLAKPGAILPGNFKIKKSRIRGVESEGMLASRSELGFDPENNENGIWILPKEAKTGESFAKLKGLEDVVFDISVPPNRSDCLSHKGLAREMSCLFSIPFSIKKISIQGDPAISVQKSIPVEVKDSRSCPRYCGRLVEGVTVRESPLWLKNRLQSLGLKSINNVVDITNFVLWDRGQPLHAFDRDKIQNLIVDPSQKSDHLLTLDEKEITLTGEELTIRDNNKVLALAGIIGGMDSRITKETKNIFIESAFFVPEKIRRTARRFGLETDSSYRFARGIDPLAVKEAMDLACLLIQKSAGGKISEDFYDIHRELAKSEKIKISLEDLETRLGYKAPPSHFPDWMKRLGCEVKSQNNTFEVLAPSYRQDLKIKEDLIEEFARLEGYDKIPERLAPSIHLPKDSDSHFLNSQKLIHFLSGKGWYQAINYSFCDPSYYKEFLGDHFYLEDLTESLQEKPANDTEFEKQSTKMRDEIEALKEEEKQIEYDIEAVKKSADNDHRIYKQTDSTKHHETAKQKYEKVKKIENTLNEIKKERENITDRWNKLRKDILNNRRDPEKEEEKMAGRKHSFLVNNPISQPLSLMKPLLIPDLVKNTINNFRRNNKFGQIFELSPIFYQEEKTYKQEFHLGLALWGSPIDIWNNKKTPNVYYIKSILESMFEAFRLKGYVWKPLPVSFLHPKQSLILEFQNKLVGFLGSLHPQLLQKHKIPLDVAVAEIRWEFLEQIKKKDLKFKPYSNLLTVEKDICFVIPFSFSVGDVQRKIKKSLGSLCEKVEIFDIYEKQGERSVSFRMRLRPKDKSWTDKQLQVFLNQAIQAVHKKFSIHLKQGF